MHRGREAIRLYLRSKGYWAMHSKNGNYIKSHHACGKYEGYIVIIKTFRGAFELVGEEFIEPRTSSDRVQ
jgi:hypothetical protein